MEDENRDESLFYRHIFIHSFRVEHPDFPFFVRIYEACVKVGLCIGKAFGFFQAHDHESGGIGICTHAVAGNHCGRQDTVLHWIACARVYGMGIFFAVFVVIVPVIPRSGYAHIGNLQYGLQFLIYSERVVYRLVDSDAP